MVKRQRESPTVEYSCFLSSSCLVMVLEYIGAWECLLIAKVSKAWRRIVNRRIRNEISLARVGSLLRPALVVTGKVQTPELQAVMAEDGRHLLVIRERHGHVFQFNRGTVGNWREAHCSEIGAAEFLGAGRLFLLQKTLRDRTAEVWFTKDWTKCPTAVAPNLENLQPIGVDEQASVMVAQYTPQAHDVACEMHIVRVDVASGCAVDTEIRLFSGRRFAQEICITEGIEAIRILVSGLPHMDTNNGFYSTPILVSTPFLPQELLGLTFSELAHLVSPCGRWLSCGCWLTNPNHGVPGAWFTASIFSLNQNGKNRRVNFSDHARNSIVSSFSADGNYLLLGWRARKSSLPWESMDIFDVRKLFDPNNEGSAPGQPICKFTRNFSLSGDPNTRLAMTWAGNYVLMAEVTGVCVLNPHQGGSLMAIIRTTDLSRGISASSQSRILNLYCQGRVALVWIPTTRKGKIGSLILSELLTCKTLITVTSRIAFCETLGETVFVADDCRTVCLRCPNNSIRVFDCCTVSPQCFSIE
uniref:F-box domain-containing protein n=1 Tax=Spongospora subterranea TaxID=70186 RepID=A0A0H5QM76_9EUKA|eukprot:CRZ02481.1 hypothetical protein [Spongospora subterranea]